MQNIDNLVYKKEWRRLPNFHKNKKIEEFVNSLNITNETNKKHILDKLILSVEV